MNDQQRAAMQMALEALREACMWLDPSRYDTDRTIAAITALREALAQPQDHSGEATDMVDGVDLASAWAEGYETGINDERESEANIGIAGFNAKINPNRQNPYGKNTPPVVPQGEPVAWGYFDADGSLMDAVGWQNGAYQTPLYTTSPSVEANDYVLCEVQQEWYVKGWKDAADKAAKVVDDLSGGDMWIQGIAENIRGMK